ncbi:MAG: condensation domain-containing protein, partial [Acidobacteriota bacterium]
MAVSDGLPRIVLRRRHGGLQEIGPSLAEQESGSASDSGPSSFVLRALGAIRSESERRTLMQLHLQEQAARTLRISASRLDPEQPLGAMGLDSLTALELKNSIEADLGIEMPLGDLLQSPSIAQLASRILPLLEAGVPAAAPRQSGPPPDTSNGQPLSYGQRALWFLHRLAPDSPAYNIAGAVQIESELDVEALRRSLQALLERHGALRATFFEEADKPVQRSGPQELHFQHLQASGWSEQQLQDRLAEEARRPFDLHKGPLLRTCLWSRSLPDSGRQHVLLLVVHHIAADFWSLGVFLQELGQLYQGFRSGRPRRLPPLPLEYPQYAAEQARMLSGKQGERLWAYWREKLSGRLPVLGLPQDRPRPPVQSFRGGSVPLRIGAAATRRIQELGRSHEATLFMTLLAAFQAWLHRYTLQDDILVGSPTGGRGRADLSGLVGYFVNPVALRADFSSDPPFSAFLNQVRLTVLEALSHQDFPFALLVERLQPNRDPSRSPLFQAMFVLQKARLFNQGGFASMALGEAGKPVQLGDLTLRSLPLEQQVAQFDLSLSMALDGESGELMGSMQYNCGLFRRSSAKRWAGHFQNLVEGAAARPQSRISELPLFSRAQRQQMLLEWNDSRSAYPRDDCLHRLVAGQARRSPAAVAVVLEEPARPALPCQLSYGGLDARANRLGHCLQGLGVGTETAVGLAGRPALEMIVGLLGILKAGGAYVPLHLDNPRERQEFMLSEARTAALLTQDGLSGEDPQGPWRRICLDSCDQWDEIARCPPTDPRSAAGPENLAYVIFTSGSTGKPKGVAVAHRAVQRLVFNTNYADLEPVDSLSQASNIAFDVSAFEIWGALTHGARLVLIPAQTKLSPLRLVEYMRGQAV